MESLGSILDGLEGDRRIYITVHDLSIEKTDELQILLSDEFTRMDKNHQRIENTCPPYQCTSFEASDVFGFKSIQIDVYRDEILKEKGGDENC